MINKNYILENNQIDVKKIYGEIIDKVKEKVSNLDNKPKFTCYIIEDEKGNCNPASEIYVRLKKKTADECGIDLDVKRIKADDFCDEMTLKMLNRVKNELAMLQLPAPKECVESFEKNVKRGVIVDVDFLSDDFFLKIINRESGCMFPATPLGVFMMLNRVCGDLKGKKVSIIGSRSKTVGKYLVHMFSNVGAIVTMYNSLTPLKQKNFLEEDIIVSCVGKPRGFFKHHHNLKNKIFIDIGVSIVDGKAIGDIHEAVRENNYYTPYVNGMGLLTRACLMVNVELAHRTYTLQKK